MNVLCFVFTLRNLTKGISYADVWYVLYVIILTMKLFNEISWVDYYLFQRYFRIFILNYLLTLALINYITKLQVFNKSELSEWLNVSCQNYIDIGILEASALYLRPGQKSFLAQSNPKSITIFLGVFQRVRVQRSESSHSIFVFLGKSSSSTLFLAPHKF